MHFMSPIKKRSSEGFTLIEILIIAPVVILAISSFVALMVAMVGDVLVTRDRGTLTFETQDALDKIEQDTRLSVQFLTTTGTQISPQGSDSNFTGTAAFTSSNALILNSLATDENPVSSGRWLIYYANQPNPCGTKETFNAIFHTKIVYFIKSGSLWRRTLVPDFNHNSPADAQTVCSQPPYDPWQQNSCSPGYAPATRCKANDVKVMDNIDTLVIRYYATPSSTTDIGVANAATASTIEAVISGKKTTAGKDITTSASVRATKVNNIAP